MNYNNWLRIFIVRNFIYKYLIALCQFTNYYYFYKNICYKNFFFFFFIFASFFKNLYYLKQNVAKY